LSFWYAPFSLKHASCKIKVNVSKVETTKESVFWEMFGSRPLDADVDKYSKRRVKVYRDPRILLSFILNNWVKVHLFRVSQPRSFQIFAFLMYI
jgi:hypothetical protein